MRIESPITLEELKIGDLIPPGVYPYQIVEAKDDVSKTSGADMIKLKLVIFLPNGKERILYDYLLESLKFKLAHFVETTGLWEKYSSGELIADDCWGKSGHCKIMIQQDKSGLYPDKNTIVDYLAENSKKPQAEEPKTKKDDFVDDDLPF